MKNKILPIILTLLLIITLSANFVLYNKLLKEKVNNSDYQEAMSQLVIMRNELDNVNSTIVSLQDDINSVENSIPASISNDEIVAEVLETLSTKSLNEQQTVETSDNRNANNNINDNVNNNANTTDNNGSINNNTQQQQQPATDLPELPDEFKMPPMTEPGNIHDGIGGGRAQ